MIVPGNSSRPRRRIAGAGALLAVLSLSSLAFSARAGTVVVDGRFEDWEGVAAVIEPAPADSRAQGLVEGVWVASNADRLHLRLRLSREISLQGGNDRDGIVLYLDRDHDADTGLPVGAMGADFWWAFGRSEGRAYALGLPVRVGQGDVGLRRAPTVTAREFEISFDRRAPVLGEPFLPGSRIRIHVGEGAPLRPEGPPGAAPATPPTVVLDGAPPVPPEIADPAREDPSHVRVLSYNVRFDGLFDRPEPFRRILRAVDPDIVSFQEIYDHSAETVRALVAEILPETPWHAVRDRRSGVVASRFPIRASGSLGEAARGLWAVLETPAGEMVVLNPHPPCCGDDDGREEELDLMAAWIRDARAAGRVSPDTPLIIAGDLNLVGRSRQVATLLEGAIVDTATHGPPRPPDGDGTALADVVPHHLTGREVYTWRGDAGPFAPGRLDYIVYTDSVLGVGTRFVLSTPELPQDLLERLGLRAADTKEASDHLPVVADFYRRAASSR